MTADPDIFRAAKLLIDQHGGDFSRLARNELSSSLCWSPAEDKIMLAGIWYRERGSIALTGSNMPPGGYRRPPIVEAVIEHRFEQTLSEDALKKFVRNVDGSYPTTEQMFDVSLEVTPVAAGQDAATVAKQELAGYRMTASDSINIVVLRKDRIATARRAPYCGWREFSEKANENLLALKKVSGYRTVTRIAARYINRIDIPTQAGHATNAKDYILAAPDLPAEAAAVDAYSLQLSMPVPAIAGHAVVRTGPVTSPLIDHTSLLLDIDLYRDQNLPQKDADLVQLLEEIRLQKNYLFEAFITARAREIFDRE